MTGEFVQYLGRVTEMAPNLARAVQQGVEQPVDWGMTLKVWGTVFGAGGVVGIITAAVVRKLNHTGSALGADLPSEKIK